MKRLPAVFACALLVLAAAPARAQDGIERFVTIRPGDLPVVLTAPHGGHDAIPGVPVRRSPTPEEALDAAKWGGFVLGGDLGTLEIAERTAARIAEITGKRPYLVASRVQRRFVDPNRPPERAYDAPGDGGARAMHEAYHRAIEKFRADVLARFGRGLLVDIHGQAAEKGTIFRGTSNRRSVATLLARDGRAALDGPQSLFGVLATRGYPVFPPVGSDAREDSRYDGGYTSVTYGRRAGGAFDAIQVEIGTDFRTDARRGRTADDLAEAVATFAKAYLPH